MSDAWQRRPEGGSAWITRLYLRFSLLLGRPIARIALVPIFLYFLLVRRFERRASRRFLSVALGRPAGLRDVARHFWTFAQVVLDRVYLLGGRGNELDVRAEGLGHLDRGLAGGRGCLLLGSHLGSFEAGRIVSLGRPEVQLRILMDRDRNPTTTSLLETLNPQLASQIIDVGHSPGETALKLGNALEAGDLVAVLGDRVGNGRSIPVRFLDHDAALPAEPFMLAAVTGAPVVLFFGLFEGGRRYRVVFEPFADRIELPRARRQEALATYAQCYADRLAHYAANYPCNWFNFYPYWS